MVESVKRWQELSWTTARGTPYRQRPQKLTNNLINSRIVACLKKHREVISVNLSALATIVVLPSPHHPNTTWMLMVFKICKHQRKMALQWKKTGGLNSLCNKSSQKKISEYPAKVRLAAQKVFFRCLWNIFPVITWALLPHCRTGRCAIKSWLAIALQCWGGVHICAISVQYWGENISDMMMILYKI